MAAPDLIRGDLNVGGTLSCTRLSAPAGSIQNVHVAAGAVGNYIDETKVRQIHVASSVQAPGTAIVAATVDLGIVGGATGEILSLDAVITGAIATGADRTATIVLLKSTGAAAFATVLSSSLVLTDANVLRTAVSAVLDSAQVGLVADDVLRLTIAVAGAAGAAGQGLCVTVRWAEDPQ